LSNLLNPLPLVPTQIIPSTDPAGICYAPELGHLLISDSEINEVTEWNNENIFEINFQGTILYNSYVTQHSSNVHEPTGICYNPEDEFYYVTNDDLGRMYQYEIIGGVFTKVLTIDLSIQGIGSINDPEGITCNPSNGHLFIADGNAGSKYIFEVHMDGTQVVLDNYFYVGDRVSDPEGIAFYDPIDHLFIVSSPDNKVFEYDLSGNYIEEYSLSELSPSTVAPQGLGFGPSSDNGSLISLYIADGGLDNNDYPSNYQDGMVYEIRFLDLALPVELLAFTASAENGKSLLNWSTASEFENLYWIIERSDNGGEEFFELARIEGHGTTPEGAEYSYLDENVIPGQTYFYRITDVDYNGRFTTHNTVMLTIPIPVVFTLKQNYPNPFNPSTTISFNLPQPALTYLTIYDILGEEIMELVTENRQAGEYNIDWDGRNSQGDLVSTGIYVYTLRVQYENGKTQQSAKRMILQR